MTGTPKPGTADWLAQVEEPIVDPERWIVDPHHHLWREKDDIYLLDQLWADTGSGHRVMKTVFVECRSEYCSDGPEHLRCTGETEFVTAVAAESRKGPGPEIAGIVAFANLKSGALLPETLDRHAEIAGELFCGIRHCAAHAKQPHSLSLPGRAPAGLMADRAFRDGVAVLGNRGLPFDSWHYHYQNREFLDLARAVPDTVLVLDHFGTPLGVGSFAKERDEMFRQWKQDIADIAKCDNVVAKLSGLSMPDNGFGWDTALLPARSDDLVDAHRPYYMHTIDCFGPNRCMMASNFPVDKRSVSYAVLYNALKKMIADFSDSEKDAMFSGNAAQVYGLT
jgi:predicted TIM-barrel fold metal-dependent hydrolase